MKFSEMDKEQKQKVFLSIGGAITTLVVMLNLLVSPAKEAAIAAEKVIEEHGEDVKRGEAVLKRDPKVRRKVKQDAAAVLEIVEKHLPPETGRYGWALENLTRVAEEVGILLDVRDHPADRFVPLKPGQGFDPSSVPMWIPYAVEVDFKTSFANLKKLLNLLEEKFPYCSVANMRVSALEEDPENHKIRLILEWPVFRLEEDMAWIQDQAGATKE